MILAVELGKMRYYTPIDRILNKIKRKGFFLYSSIILLSTIYVFYSISRLPDVLKIEPAKQPRRKLEKKSQDKLGERKIKTERRKRAEVRESLAANPAIDTKAKVAS